MKTKLKDRVIWYAPWRITRPWWFKVGVGSDEWHNRSIRIGLPFLGMFAVFWEPELTLSGPYHLNWACDERRVIYDISCKLCKEQMDLYELGDPITVSTGEKP